MWICRRRCGWKARTLRISPGFSERFLHDVNHLIFTELHLYMVAHYAVLWQDAKRSPLPADVRTETRAGFLISNGLLCCRQIWASTTRRVVVCHVLGGVSSGWGRLSQLGHSFTNANC